ncbi:MAG: DNA polymerase III subunit beta [Patescibacteria group bacterium]
MKFSCKTENLKKGLTTISHVVGKSHNLPILQNVLLSVEDGVLKLATTNLEIGIQTIINGKAHKTGSVTVPARLLTDYINNLSAETVDISTQKTNLHITAEKSQTTIKGMDASEFPLLPTIEAKARFGIHGALLKSALQQTVFASANDTTRPELCTVLMLIANNKLTLAATDSYRLAEKVIDVDISEQFEVLVPQSTLQEVYRVFDDNIDEVVVEISDNQIKFSHSQTYLISRVSEGQFPDYKQIIPDKSNTTAQVSVLLFSKAIRAASIFCRQGINDVKVVFGKNNLKVYAVNDQVGESQVEVEAEVKGGDGEIVFNYHYLLDVLAVQETDTVLFGMTKNDLPGVITPVGDDTYTYVIMPIRQ